MEQAERERRVADLVAHKTPDELARALIELQGANDDLLFDTERIAQANKASAAVVLPAPEEPAEEPPDDEQEVTRSVRKSARPR